jgi:cytochrome c oxidase subunit I+III
MDIKRWLTTTNHKDVGVLYILASFLLGAIGAALGMLMKAQTTAPGLSIMSPDFYNQAVSVHGLVMVLWFVSPLSLGLANYVIPPMIGCRDLAFPRLNALSFWMFLFGGLVAASAFLLPGGAIATGWTVYAPLNTPQYSAGNAFGIVLGVAGLAMLIVAIILGTINFITTIAVMRAPGMTYMRMPLFVWFMLATFGLMFVIFPVLAVAGLALLTDWLFGTNFFAAPHGSLLWAHYFWIFGHPEVYVLLFPGLGVAAEVLQTFSRRPIYGKKIIIASLMVAWFMSLIVWGHHMFITGVSATWRIYMSIMTELISIPFGVIALCYIATLWGGQIKYKTPMIFVTGFLGMFIALGGTTGVFNSSAALDYNIRGTYWILAHFHFVLVPAVLMTLMAGIYYWFPKITGRMYSERLGKAHFVLSFIGALVFYGAWFAIRDMPRRMVTYTPDFTIWAQWQLVSSVGAAILALGQLVFLYNMISSIRNGPKAEGDPWGGSSLEWTISSPPPVSTFEKRPVISTEGVTQYKEYPGTGKPTATATNGGSADYKEELQ